MGMLFFEAIYSIQTFKVEMFLLVVEKKLIDCKVVLLKILFGI